MWESFESDDEVKTQVAVQLGIVIILMILRSGSASRLKNLEGEHILNMHALNKAFMFKEVFLAYLNAALLEPVLAIAGMEAVSGPQLIINVLSLCSIFWWIHLITDAFDYQDTAQQFKYATFRDEVDAASASASASASVSASTAAGGGDKDGDEDDCSWLRYRTDKKAAKEDRAELVGSIGVDVALWFMILCIAAAWMPGVVTHRDVLHAYAVVIGWVVLHHKCRQATSWGSSYFVSLLMPSIALMPLEYCVPLTDCGDYIEDLDSVKEWRNFIANRTGVKLIIYT
jgi:hypothetical protein